jgi:hypothetical protein
MQPALGGAVGSGGDETHAADTAAGAPCRGGWTRAAGDGAVLGTAVPARRGTRHRAPACDSAAHRHSGERKRGDLLVLTFPLVKCSTGFRFYSYSSVLNHTQEECHRNNDIGDAQREDLTNLRLFYLQVLSTGFD